jgi:hypothetical protein
LNKGTADTDAEKDTVYMAFEYVDHDLTGLIAA